jgi:signal transduction histidine kinase
LLPFLPCETTDEREPHRWQGELSMGSAPHRVVEVSCTSVETHGDDVQYVYVLHDVSRQTELNWWREQLLYQVAHEIRGSLGIVNTALVWWDKHEAGKGTPDSAEIRSIGTQAIAGVERLLQDLLSAGSIRAGRLQVHPEPTCVGDLIADALVMVEPNLEAWDRRIGVQVPSPAPWIMADANSATRVLVNLLSNATKYSPPGETILLEVEELANGQVGIAVEDHGPGIALEEQPWLFERFYRTKGSKAGGIGLGLGIAKGIVEAHGGTIGLRSAPEQGTRVWFTLPRVERPVETPPAAGDVRRPRRIAEVHR